MYDKYQSGDVVFVRPVTSTRDLYFGLCCGFVTTSPRLLKAVYQSKLGDEYLKLCSYNAKLNPSGEREYPDRDINKSAGP